MFQVPPYHGFSTEGLGGSLVKVKRGGDSVKDRLSQILLDLAENTFVRA